MGLSFIYRGLHFRIAKNGELLLLGMQKDFTKPDHGMDNQQKLEEALRITIVNLIF